MSKCTAKQAVASFDYWDLYYEKASSAYAQTRAKSAFAKNKGSANYTYFGYFCGIQGGAWCAMAVATAITEACGGDKSAAKEIMYGVYPYTSCDQVWDKAPNDKKFWSYHQRFVLGKGSRTNYKPQYGDIIIFTDDCKSRDHTGMVIGVDDKYVYTREGNSANMCRTRCYLLTSAYIYGWVRPAYAASQDATPTSGEKYGAKCSTPPVPHILSKGCAGGEVVAMQLLLIGYGYDLGEKGADGDFGKLTEAAVRAFQADHGIYGEDGEPDGICGSKTWAALLDRPEKI